ncbi:MAG: DUF445 domain-containing protein [Pseudomonadota bacterium]
MSTINIAVDKNKELQRMKTFALTVLAIAFVGYVMGMYFHIGALKAFSEAAMVGGIADWFAVVALFRHPMGIKQIPHTAIIPNSKSKIADNLGLFIQNEFISKIGLRDLVDRHDPALKIAHYLSNESNANMIADKITKAIPPLLKLINDESVSRFVSHQLSTHLEKTDLSPILAQTLDILTKDGRHHEIINNMIPSLKSLLNDYKPTMHNIIKSEVGVFKYFGADTIILNKIYNGIELLLHEIENQPNHSFYQKLDEIVDHLVLNLKTSSELQAKVNAIKYDLMHNKTLQNYLGGIGAEIKAMITHDLSQPDSQIASHIKNGIISFAIQLEEDQELSRKFNILIKKDIVNIVEQNKHFIGDFIRNTVEEWDAEEMSQKLELEIGQDLQYIRINGAVVGGLAGLVIYWISQFVF